MITLTSHFRSKRVDESARYFKEEWDKEIKLTTGKNWGKKKSCLCEIQIMNVHLIVQIVLDEIIYREIGCMAFNTYA